MADGSSDSNSSAGPKWKDSKAASGLREGGASMARSGQDMMSAARDQAAAGANRQTPIPSYKRGGKVRKTGLARLHKGEEVIPRGKVKKVKRAMRREKGRR